MTQEFIARVRVRYAETDQMGVAYHGNFFAWFEVGRVELLRSLGLSYREMEEDGAVLPVAKASCRYRAPARYDDEILIYTRCIALRGALVAFGYRLVRATPGIEAAEYVLLAEGETTHMVVDRSMNACLLPEKYELALRATLGSDKPPAEARPVSDCVAQPL